MTDYRLTDALITYIAYFRVSTGKQAASGLGLGAQESAVKAHCVNGRILRTYTEVETGKRSDRPELMKALADCRRSKSVLCIAKLDRLARDVEFTSWLMNSGIEFVCCDVPGASRLTLHVLAAVAENEARATSERTKAALAEFKEKKIVPRAIREFYNGNVPAEIVEATAGKLGSARTGRRFTPEETSKGVKAASAAVSADARKAYADISPIAKEMKAAGKSLREIAAHFNAEGYSTRNGSTWHATSVQRVLKYAA